MATQSQGSAETLISPNTFFTSTIIRSKAASREEEKEVKDYLIYFLPGNPGLISYYHTCLSLLTNSISKARNVGGGGIADSTSSFSSQEASLVEICGYSLGGFEVVEDGDDSNARSRRKELGLPTVAEPKLYSLQAQIEHVEKRLFDIVKGRRTRRRRKAAYDAATASKARSRTQVVLVGHSVGAYMAMELIRWHHERESKDGNVHQLLGSDEDDESGFDIVGGIMLFPTVVDIVKSANGQRLGVSLTIKSCPA